MDGHIKIFISHTCKGFNNSAINKKNNKVKYINNCIYNSRAKSLSQKCRQSSQCVCVFVV